MFTFFESNIFTLQNIQCSILWKCNNTDGVSIFFSFSMSCLLSPTDEYKFATLILLLLYDVNVSCHRPFLPGTSLEPAVIPNAQAYYYYYYYSTIWMSPVTGLLFLVILLNQRWSPPLTLQVSHCSTFRIMCDVPSIPVLSNECIECFPGTASKFFLKLLVTIPVAPIMTGIIVHFRFHIRCISIHRLLYYYYYYYYYYYTIP